MLGTDLMEMWIYGAGLRTMILHHLSSLSASCRAALRGEVMVLIEATDYIAAATHNALSLSIMLT